MAKLGYGFLPTHPGEVIKEEIEYRGISQRKLANSIGYTPSVVNEILNGKRPVTTLTALLLEAALDIPADSLLNLQLKYDMHVSMQDASLKKRLASVERLVAS